MNNIVVEDQLDSSHYFFVDTVENAVKTTADEKNEWNAELITNGVGVIFMLNCRGQVTILFQNIYEQMAKPILNGTRVRLMTYGSKQPTLFDRKCVCEFEYKSKNLKVKVYVVPTSGPPILGLESCVKNQEHLNTFQNGEVFKNFKDLFLGQASFTMLNIVFKSRIA